ncbi:MAG: hypothetical protein HWE14_02215 [Flavobacteriia bacterium]|nr:hypothetical protein [Flavobacteriia bacterium]
MSKKGYRLEVGGLRPKAKTYLWIFTLVFTLLSIHAKSQVAVIVNPTNLHAAPDENSEVLDHLEVGFTIYIYYWDEEEYEDWHIVEYDNDTFSRARVDSSILTTKYKGYISKDDLWYIEDLMTPDNVNLLEFTSEFDTSGHQVVSIMEKGEDYSYLDEPHWGTDGLLPSTQVDSIIYFFKGNRFSIPHLLVSDIYNTEYDEFNVAYYPPYYIFEKGCSDGAGAYHLAWVFRDEELVQRLLVIPF